jgi:hypothetical protein
VRFPVADIVEDVLRLAAKSFRNVCRAALVDDVLVDDVVLLVALVEELLPPEALLIAETRLLKSVFKVLRLLVPVDDELDEESFNWEIRSSILLEKLE